MLQEFLIRMRQRRRQGIIQRSRRPEWCSWRSSCSSPRNGPNTVSENTVSNTELSEFFGPHRAPGTKLSEFLSAYYLCAKANSPSFFFAELSEFFLSSETVLSKQYSARFLLSQLEVCSQTLGKPSNWARISEREMCHK